MTPEVVKEIFPFRRAPPPLLFADTVKIDRESGDQIELPLEIRQRLKRANSRGDALDSKKRDQFIRKWKVAEIESETGMAELFGQKKKKSGATAEIEDVFWRGAIQFQIADPGKIDFQPALDIGVLRVTISRAGIPALDLAQPFDVDLCQERFDSIALKKSHGSQ